MDVDGYILRDDKRQLEAQLKCSRSSLSSLTSILTKIKDITFDKELTPRQARKQVQELLEALFNDYS